MADFHRATGFIVIFVFMFPSMILSMNNTTIAGTTSDPTSGSTVDLTGSTYEPTGSTADPTGSTADQTGSTTYLTGSTTDSTTNTTGSTADPTGSTANPSTTASPTTSTASPTTIVRLAISCTVLSVGGVEPTFTSALQDSTSPDFIELQLVVCTGFISIYRTNLGLSISAVINCRVRRFRRGSVAADVDIEIVANSTSAAEALQQQAESVSLADQSAVPSNQSFFTLRDFSSNSSLVNDSSSVFITVATSLTTTATSTATPTTAAASTTSITTAATTRAPYVSSVFVRVFIPNRTFDESLLNVRSTQFQDLQNEACAQVIGYIRDTLSIAFTSIGCIVVRFERGSVIAYTQVDLGAPSQSEADQLALRTTELVEERKASDTVLLYGSDTGYLSIYQTGSSLSPGAIAGIAIGACSLLFLVILVGFCFFLQSARTQNANEFLMDGRGHGLRDKGFVHDEPWSGDRLDTSSDSSSLDHRRFVVGQAIDRYGMDSGQHGRRFGSEYGYDSRDRAMHSPSDSGRRNFMTPYVSDGISVERNPAHF